MVAVLVATRLRSPCYDHGVLAAAVRPSVESTVEW